MLIGYMRVSSETDRQNTNLQKDALLLAGVNLVDIFEDKASGAKDNRPGLKKAVERLQKGDCLVVWKLDRLGRSLPHLLMIIATLKGKEASFRSLTEQMDTTTPHGELLFSFFGALAQYERALTRERIMAGLEAASKRGRFPGRPRLFDDRLKEIEERLIKGEDNKSIMQSMDIKTSTFYYILRNYLDKNLDMRKIK